MLQRSLLMTVGLVALSPGLAAPQARLTDVTPLGVDVSATRLGSVAPEAVVAGAADFMPGDLLFCGEPDAVVTLECPPGSSNSVNLTAPFRVAIAVPGSGGCHIDLQAGDADVLDEENTEVTIGGVEMKAVGTQFAARVWRGEGGAERRIVVFDGEVEVQGLGESVRLHRGTMLTFKSSLAGRQPVAAPSAEVERSARIYSRVDLATAQKAGTVENPELLQATLQRQYYEVLAEPENEAKRVELARTQIEYQVSDRAVYNLKRAGVVDQESFDRYQIDGSVLEQGASAVNRLYLERQRVVVPSNALRLPVTLTEAEPELPPVESRTFETDLELIAAGRAKEALEGIEYRLENGRSAGARDFYALGRAYESLGLDDRALSAVRRALYYTARDNQLDESEVRWSKAFVERSGG